MKRTFDTFTKLSRLVGARTLNVLLVGSLMLMTPMIALASSSNDEDVVLYDARLQNYKQNMQLDVGGTALTWVFLLLLAGLCVMALFKNPNRSHLD